MYVEMLSTVYIVIYKNKTEYHKKNNRHVNWYLKRGFDQLLSSCYYEPIMHQKYRVDNILSYRIQEYIIKPYEF